MNLIIRLLVTAVVAFALTYILSGVHMDSCFRAYSGNIKSDRNPDP